MDDDAFERELETIRKRRLEELNMNKESSTPDHPQTVTGSDFQGFVKKHPNVIVDCWAPWCGPCRNLAPVLDELAVAFKGKVVFGKMNVDENMQVPQSFGIQSIPTLLFFKNGEFVKKQVGAPPKPALEAMIREFVK